MPQKETRSADTSWEFIIPERYNILGFMIQAMGDENLGMGCLPVLSATNCEAKKEDYKKKSTAEKSPNNTHEGRR